ncbi:MAG: dephospho-CoA kinase [Clostridiaceae bacterium]|nr:dephospho-CoA kinase [Clostridiaceae bacterium]
MKVIGVTGGIGSGKSTVTKILHDLGARVIDADKVAREVTGKGQPALEEIRSFFGGEVINEKGELDRKKLSSIVFGDKEKLEMLNAITHKYIVNKIMGCLEMLRKEQAELVVLDAPLPVEHGFLDIVDEVWVVVAAKEERIKRIMQRSGISHEEALNRLNAQLNDEEYLKHADEVIYNDGSIDELEKTVAKLYIVKKSR